MESPEGPATSDMRGASSSQPQTASPEEVQAELDAWRKHRERQRMPLVPPNHYRSEQELVRSLMQDHPGLTEKEARRDLEDFGGH
jgi:hypothetical protein